MIFAAVVGNVGDVVSNINASRMDFQARYMHPFNTLVLRDASL